MLRFEWRQSAFFPVMLALLLACNAHAAERKFFSGYVGTLPPSTEDRAKTYFNRPEVRALFASLETGPIATEKGVRVLSGTPTQLADLLRLRLLREDQGQLHIGFPYFTSHDIDAVHAVAAKYVPSLVAAYKTKQARLETILGRYPVPGVSRKRLAFVLVAGFSLNWDALELLEKEGYRQPMLVQGDGWQYTFWASEDVPNYSYRGYYWGSSTFPSDAMNLAPPLKFAFSSFGDPLSDPRMNLPDLLALPPDQMTPPVRAAAQRLGLRDDNALELGLKNVIGLSRARSIGAILFALRNGATRIEQICAAAASDGTDCEGEMQLLVATKYVKTSRDHQYALSVPVFDMSDQAMLNSALDLSRAVIVDWLKQNYAPIQGDLSDLTAVRQGISYAAMFTQIWHELFGLTTRELIESGQIEDPRAANVVWNGSIPVVWRADLYHHKFE
jgi:hypothetical protein